MAKQKIEVFEANALSSATKRKLQNYGEKHGLGDKARGVLSGLTDEGAAERVLNKQIDPHVRNASAYISRVARAAEGEALQLASHGQWDYDSEGWDGYEKKQQEAGDDSRADHTRSDDHESDCRAYSN